MILDEITIHNYGIYNGRHSLKLSPPSKKQPIVLIGGLNGGGKTTLLDALHLTLYGKRARCSNRGNLPYDEYLRRSINHKSSSREGAAVEIQFRSWSEGVEHTYRIHRSWSASSKVTSEKVEVVHNGAFDRVLTDAWAELVEEIIPVGISHLFFFDGEKIEEFVDFNNSAQLLSKAIHSLLGLDIVDRLTTDLSSLEKRKQLDRKDVRGREQIEAVKAELTHLEELREETNSQRGVAQNELDRLKKHLKEVMIRYEDEGGQLFEQRKELEERRDALSWELWAFEEDLKKHAEGVSPLLLVADLLEEVHHQDQREETCARADAVNEILGERDLHLLTEAKRHNISKPVIGSLKKFLKQDRDARSSAVRVNKYLNLRPEARESLHTLNGVILPETLNEVSRLLLKAEELRAELSEQEQKILGIPDQESISQFLELRKEAQAAIGVATEKIISVDLTLKRINRELEQKQRVLTALLEEAVKDGFEREGSARILFHSQRVRNTLDKFRAQMVERHVSRIGQLVFDCFRQLLRKDSLISDLKISPEDFSIELRGADGSILSPERLSAGERQLLAVSMLWGLARASGRPLPAVIDTPLGRLDASHRNNLVERYFPYASHQVLLLSTDEEIDEHNYELLKPYIGRTYCVEFDESIGSSRVRPGYFW